MVAEKNIGEDNPHSEREPWLAALYSLLVPGLGHIYVGKKILGTLWFCAVLGATFFGIISVLHLSMNTMLGFILIGLSLVLDFVIAAHAHSLVKSSNNLKFESLRKGYQDPYLSIILSMIFPGIGHLYLRRWLIGAALIVVSLFLYSRPSTSEWGIVLNLYIISAAFHSFISAPDIRTVNRSGGVRAVLLLGASFFIFDAFVSYVENHHVTYGVGVGFSNSPTIEDGDIFLIYVGDNCVPQQGDFIRIQWEAGTSWVKRLISFENETVEIVNNKVYVNQRALEGEPFKKIKYTTDSTSWYATPGNPYKVPSGDIFVLGDNPLSLDSRSLGGVEKDRIDGIVYKIIWPVDRLETLRH